MRPMPSVRRVLFTAVLSAAPLTVPPLAAQKYKSAEHDFQLTLPPRFKEEPLQPNEG